jgi:hypothetical protein
MTDHRQRHFRVTVRGGGRPEPVYLLPANSAGNARFEATRLYAREHSLDLAAVKLEVTVTEVEP